MHHWKIIAIALITQILPGCEADSGDLEECSTEVTGACAQLVSCCDLVLSDDVDGQSLAGASCLNDQLVALSNRDGNGEAQAECEELLNRPEYADICFACEDEQISDTEARATESDSEE